MKRIILAAALLAATTAHATIFTLDAFLHQGGAESGIDSFGNPLPALPSNASPFTGWFEIDGPLAPGAKLVNWNFPQNIVPHDPDLYTTDFETLNVGPDSTFVGFSVPWQEVSFTLLAGSDNYIGNGTTISTHGRWDLMGLIDGRFIVSNYGPATTAVPEPSTWAMLIAGIILVGRKFIHLS